MLAHLSRKPLERFPIVFHRIVRDRAERKCRLDLDDVSLAARRGHLQVIVAEDRA
jgi:hypothetical protein